MDLPEGAQENLKSSAHSFSNMRKILPIGEETSPIWFKSSRGTCVLTAAPPSSAIVQKVGVGSSLTMIEILLPSGCQAAEIGVQSSPVIRRFKASCFKTSRGGAPSRLTT